MTPLTWAVPAPIANDVLITAGRALLLGRVGMSSANDRIHDVLTARAIAKVAHLVAVLPARAVAHIRARGARADEGFRYEGVNPRLEFAAARREDDEPVALTVRRWLENPAAAPAAHRPALHAAHPAEVAHLVQALPAANREPSLARKIPLAGDRRRRDVAQGVPGPAPVGPVTSTPAPPIMGAAAAGDVTCTLAHVDSYPVGGPGVAFSALAGALSYTHSRIPSTCGRGF